MQCSLCSCGRVQAQRSEGGGGTHDVTDVYNEVRPTASPAPAASASRRHHRTEGWHTRWDGGGQSRGSFSLINSGRHVHKLGGGRDTLDQQHSVHHHLTCPTHSFPFLTEQQGSDCFQVESPITISSFSPAKNNRNRKSPSLLLVKHFEW